MELDWEVRQRSPLQPDGLIHGDAAIEIFDSKNDGNDGVFNGRGLGSRQTFVARRVHGSEGLLTRTFSGPDS